MAICGSCGESVTRLRTKFIGTETKDECEKCAPDGFHVDPAWLTARGAMGWEAKPHMYKKVGDVYVAKDELRADTEAQILKGSTEENEALENKRNDPNRLVPLTEKNHQSARKIALAFTNAYEESLANAKKAREEEWRQATQDLRIDA